MDHRRWRGRGDHAADQQRQHRHRFPCRRPEQHAPHRGDGRRAWRGHRRPSGLPRPGRLRASANRRAGHRAGQRHALPAWRTARIRPAAGPVAATRQAPRRALHAPGAGRGRRAPVRRDPATPGTGTAALLHARFGHLAHRPGTGPAAGARVLRRPRLRPQRLHRLHPAGRRPRSAAGRRQGPARLPRGQGAPSRARTSTSPSTRCASTAIPPVPWSWSPAPVRAWRAPASASRRRVERRSPRRASRQAFLPFPTTFE